MAAVKKVLQRCDPVLLDSDLDRESDWTEAPQMALYLTDSRRVQKVLWRQLSVLDSMMSLLEDLESSQSLISQPCPPHPVSEARGRWKTLKAKSRAAVEETETLLISFQDRIQQIHNRRQTLTQLAKQLSTEMQQHQQLQESLQNTHHALRSCQQQLNQLEAESEAELAQLTDRHQLRDQLQRSVSAIQHHMQVNLLTVSQSQVTLELRPRLPSHLSSSKLKPLKLSVTWSHDNRFILQADEGTCVLAQDQVCGRWGELSAALLEMMQFYVAEAELVMEIQKLRASFPIDWRPAQRQLVYLKTASLVCHLEVGEGYPSTGRPRLHSIQHKGRPLDITGLKPPSSEPSLTEWLVFLCTTSLI